MQKLRCPNCGTKGITATRKIFSFIYPYTHCDNCEAKLEVPVYYLYVLLGIPFVAINVYRESLNLFIYFGSMAVILFMFIALVYKVLPLVKVRHERNPMVNLIIIVPFIAAFVVSIRFIEEPLNELFVLGGGLIITTLTDYLYMKKLIIAT